MATIKKAQIGTVAKAKADATRVARRPQVINIEKDKKDAADLKKLKGRYTAIAVPDKESPFKGDSVRYYPGQKGSLGTPYIRDLGKLKGMSSDSDKDLLKVSRSKSARTYQDTATVKANPKLMSNQKNGGVTKAKSGGKWMQKAAASIKRRGTEGKCTPITKPGCTGRAKALAKTFKKIAAKRKGK